MRFPLHHVYFYFAKTVIHIIMFLFCVIFRRRCFTYFDEVVGDVLLRDTAKVLEWNETTPLHGARLFQ